MKTVRRESGLAGIVSSRSAPGDACALIRRRMDKSSQQGRQSVLLRGARASSPLLPATGAAFAGVLIASSICAALLLAASVAGAAPLLATDAPSAESSVSDPTATAAGLSSDDAPVHQRLQLGVAGNFDWDEGERNLIAGITTDWIPWRRLLVHAALSGEQRVSTFWKGDAAIGVGTMLQKERSSAPFWIGGGVTATGLWGHELVRSCLRFGGGYRYHASPRIGFAVNEDIFVYGRNKVRAMTTFGFVYVVTSSASGE